MAISNSAIIVIVLVGCLAVTALGAALFIHYNPANESRFSPNHEQHQYMRQVRARNYTHLRHESMGGRVDLESRFTSEEALAYAHPSPHSPRV
ncbi:uncharacterized protein N7477_001924 [Penicillium maclennaniae]|uniref:uncharacterized protein n=1 Tax=Penicillium maclennaniae TaxID=1343394 RepID=UPI002541AE72|nr:uncharacterized protein N7477_001924 [Penicillium maclennaniae]KAJ5681984.1 hypothetical protein N7477_001924 [Penicillium maclennaniae]